jgi:O-antigen/teichoic acid export membrane protein
MSEKADGAASGRRLLILGGLWFLSFLTARAVLEVPDLPRWQRVAAALVPAPLFAAFLVAFSRGIRRMDELQLRIQLEGLAIAYALALLLIMTLGLMELALPLSPADWSYRHILPMLVVFWTIGIAIAHRRYE